MTGQGLVAPRLDSAEVAYVHLPLAQHPAARGAALAQICTRPQGRGRQMHEYLMTNESWRSDTAWVAIAHGLGVEDTLEFKRCMLDSASSELLARGVALAKRLQVTGTPTFVGTHGTLLGPIDAAALQRIR